jgi:hypothetical protein
MIWVAVVGLVLIVAAELVQARRERRHGWSDENGRRWGGKP